MPWTSGRGTAIRFGAASCAALVVEFCWQGQGQGCFLSEKCLSRFVFEILHLPGELPAFLDFPRLRIRNRSHTPALCEYVLENPRCFRMIYTIKVSPTNPDFTFSADVSERVSWSSAWFCQSVPVLLCFSLVLIFQE